MKTRASFWLFALLFACSSFAVDEQDAAKTKHPIVLIHGLFGFDSLMGLIHYWGQIPKVLRKNGAEVFIAHVSQAHTIETCGEQLYLQLKKWRREKYNLIGHSFGGLTADYVRKKYPDAVASVTTMGTPHKGCKMADIALYCINSLPFSKVIWQAGNVVCHGIGLLSGHISQQDIQKAVRCLTTEIHQESNNNIIQDPDACPRYSCGSSEIKPQGLFDVCGISFYVLDFLLYGGEDSDGLVEQKSMIYGDWIGALKGAHHIIPSKGKISELFEKFFLEHAKRLKAQGR
jgi:triacylglycerol lipase